MEKEFWASVEKKKGERQKSKKGNTRSTGLVKFRGTAGPLQSGRRSVKIEHMKRERRIGKIGKETEAK